MKDNIKRYVGVDVSKNKLDIYFPDQEEWITIKNTEEGYKKILPQLKACCDYMVVMEASGGYEKSFLTTCHANKILVSLVNAKRVRDYARALGIHVKTDKMDARVIYLFALGTKPKAHQQEESTLSKLKEWLARRYQVIELIKLEKQHLELATSTQTDLLTLRSNPC